MVFRLLNTLIISSNCLSVQLFFVFFSVFPPSAKEHNGREKRAAEESETSVSGSAPLLLPDPREALLCAGLCKWRRGMCVKLEKENVVHAYYSQ